MVMSAFTMPPWSNLLPTSLSISRLNGFASTQVLRYWRFPRITCLVLASRLVIADIVMSCGSQNRLLFPLHMFISFSIATIGDPRFIGVTVQEMTGELVPKKQHEHLFYKINKLFCKTFKLLTDNCHSLVAKMNSENLPYNFFL